MGMSPKKYLDQIRRLRILIDQRRQELESLRAARFGSSVGIDYGDNCSRNSVHMGASFERVIAESIDLSKEIEGMIERYISLRHKIIGEIQQIEKPEYAQVLFKRYVEEKRFETIAHEMNYSYVYTRELHQKALQTFGKTISENN